MPPSYLEDAQPVGIEPQSGIVLEPIYGEQWKSYARRKIAVCVLRGGAIAAAAIGGSGIQTNALLLPS